LKLASSSGPKSSLRSSDAVGSGSPAPPKKREQIVHPSDERARLVPEIPEQADRPAGAKHARDLRQRELGVEPVEGLPGGDDVHPTRQDRNPLRRTLQRLDAR